MGQENDGQAVMPLFYFSSENVGIHIIQTGHGDDQVKGFVA